MTYNEKIESLEKELIKAVEIHDAKMKDFIDKNIGGLTDADLLRYKNEVSLKAQELAAVRKQLKESGKDGADTFI